MTGPTEHERAIVYVDGFNLYFGLRAMHWQKYYWLNIRNLALLLLRGHQSLVRVKYFTSRITTGRSTMERQNSYLSAVGSLSDTDMFYGKYLLKVSRCRFCKATFEVPEEKMTDVNIATEMITDAFSNRFDTAVLISADSDLRAPIRAIRHNHPTKRIIVAFPPRRHSKELYALAHGVIHIGRWELQRSQFNDKVQLSDGRVAERPERWR